MNIPMRPSDSGSDDDDDDLESGNDDGDAEEEEPQESSGGLWDEVESFLNRPSPSLSVLAKPEKKSATGNVLPTLRFDHQRQRKSSEPESQSAHRASTRPARSLCQQSSKTASSTGATQAIDPKLLQEAFAYAQKVAMMDFEDDQQEQVADVINDRHHPLGRSNSRSFSTSSSSSLNAKDGASGGNVPRAPSHGTLKKQSSSGVSAKSDEAKKKKSTATKTSVYGSGAKPVKKKSERRIKEAMQWDAASAGDAGSSESGGASRKNMDSQTLQSLVSNFQNGTTLDELRKELAASQQSMALSRQVLHEAAKSFFQPTR